MNTIKELEALIESLYRLEKKLSSCVLTLKLERETHVPDLMTRIRILPGVSVVAQKNKVARFFDGDAQLQIAVKFLALSDDLLTNIKTTSKQIKKLPGVKSVAIDTYEKQKITFKGRKIVI
jgi:hypothetical protein